MHNTAGTQSETLNRQGISVVVIGRNEGQRLARCLEAIGKVRGVSVRELIYVDSASTDGSPELAKGYGATTIELKTDRPTAALGRNAGWRQATSDIVLFLDGDTAVDPDFPRIASEALLSNPEIAVVWGNLTEAKPEASPYIRVLELEWLYPPGSAEFCGGNAMMRRSAVADAGGFDETLIAGEEPDLCRRMRASGLKILHIDSPMAQHDLQITRFKQYWRRAVRSGHAYAEVSARFRKSGDQFWSADRRANLIRGGFWLTSLLAAVVASIWFGMISVGLWVAVLCALSLRSAWKARWKSKNAWTLVLYGFHSQLQQIPVLIGQLQFELTKGRKGSPKIIEYKERRAE
jgi:GT2 family glycosyltransferase